MKESSLWNDKRTQNILDFIWRKFEPLERARRMRSLLISYRARLKSPKRRYRLQCKFCNKQFSYWNKRKLYCRDICIRKAREARLLLKHLGD